MTFAHYDFTRGSSIHEHFHAEEEVYEVIEGELEVTIDGAAQIARAGLVATVTYKTAWLLTQKLRVRSTRKQMEAAGDKCHWFA